MTWYIADSVKIADSRSKATAHHTSTVFSTETETLSSSFPELQDEQEGMKKGVKEKEEEEKESLACSSIWQKIRSFSSFCFLSTSNLEGVDQKCKETNGADKKVHS